MTVPDVSVLLVTYNSEAFIDRCLQSLRDGAECAYEVIVADNDSRDGTVAHLESRWPDVCVTRRAGNMGCACGNNPAARAAVGRHVMLLNGDAWPEPGA